MKQTRVINCVIHNLTAPQILEKLLRLFSESKAEPVYLATSLSEGEQVVKQIRVELSRIRKTAKEENYAISLFGFTHEAMPEIRTREKSINFEYHSLKFRLTSTQNFKTRFSNFSFEELTS